MKKNFTKLSTLLLLFVASVGAFAQNVTYTKGTQLKPSDFADGKKVILVTLANFQGATDGYPTINQVPGNVFDGATLHTSSQLITKSNVITLEKSGDNYYLKTSDGKYLTNSGDDKVSSTKANIIKADKTNNTFCFTPTALTSSDISGKSNYDKTIYKQDYSLYFQVVGSTANDKVRLACEQPNTKSAIRKAGGEYCYWNVFEVTETPCENITLTLNQATSDSKYYATYFNDGEKALSFTGEGTKAYYLGNGGQNSSEISLTEITDKVIPTGLGVVFVSDNATVTLSSTTKTATVNPANDTDPSQTLLGSKEAAITFFGKNAINATYYTFAEEDNKVGFYKFTDNNVTIPAYKCYLKTTGASGVKGFTLNFGTTTGINAVATQPTTNVSFDILGRPTTNNSKGLIIQSGKKLMK